MDCREIQKLIPAYLDNELEPAEAKEVKEHLPACPACQKEFKAFESSWAMLEEAEDIQPEPGFIGKFWTRLALEQSWHEKISEAVKNGLFKKHLVPVLVTACMVVLIGSFALRNYLQARQTDRMLASLSQEDLEMVENIELVENFDLIQEIDLFEDLDIIENLDVLES